MFDVSNIEQALKKGCRLHTFRSGGGLRVVRIEDDQKTLMAYGEHPAIETAIQHTEQCIVDGNPSYDEMYGSSGKYPHYLTGSTSSSTELDTLVKQGGNFDAWYDDEKGEFVVELLSHEQVHHPQEIMERVKKTLVPEKYKDEERGFEYEISPAFLPCDEGKSTPSACSIKVISKPEGKSDWGIYEVSRHGYSSEGLWDAINRAFEAEKIELSAN